MLGKVDPALLKELKSKRKRAKATEYEHKEPAVRHVLERKRCPRCERMIPVVEYESHQLAHATEIVPGLYLGGERNATNLKEMEDRLGITHVLNVAWECANSYPNKFNYKKIDLDDNAREALLPHLRATADHIGEYSLFFPTHTHTPFTVPPLDGLPHADKILSEGGKILVHCVQGMSRSASVIISYLMLKRGMKLKDAHEHVKGRRSIIRPNEGFVQQLIQLEREVLGKVSAGLEDFFPALQKKMDSEEAAVDAALAALMKSCML